MEKEASDKAYKTGFESFSSLIGSASKNLEKLKSKGMDDYGLSGTHTLCLRQLYIAPNGLTRTELAKRLEIDRAQITRIIGELLSKEFVEEVGSGSNYRKKIVLTDKGIGITSQVNDRVGKIHAFVSGDIPHEDLEVFYKTLSKICENLKNAEKIL